MRRVVVFVVGVDAADVAIVVGANVFHDGAANVVAVDVFCCCYCCSCGCFLVVVATAKTVRMLTRMFCVHFTRACPCDFCYHYASLSRERRVAATLPPSRCLKYKRISPAAASGTCASDTMTPVA